MKGIRKRNPLMFDLATFLTFSVVSFGAFFLTEVAGTAGAVASLAGLGIVSLILIVSR